MKQYSWGFLEFNATRRNTKTRKKADNLEYRVEQIKKELENTKYLFHKTLIVLEAHLSKDIDGDGKIG